MRSRISSALCSFLSLVLCAVTLELSEIQVYPKNGGISGVFIVGLRSQPYNFNATTAISVCTSLGVNIASRDQVETAQRNGLQTCRYGWVEENIAVIPRTERNPNCGQNKVGIIAWVAPLERLFDVFCYKSTGQTEAMPTTTQRMSHAKLTSPSIFLPTQANKRFLTSSSPPQSIFIGFITSMIPTVFSSVVVSMTTQSSETFKADISLSSAGYQPSSFTSISTTAPFTTSFTNASSVTNSSNETDEQLHTGKEFSFGAVYIACIIVFVMLLMMVGTGAVWYFKIKRPHRLSPWERICHKDMFETEMWKHTEHFSMQNDSGDCSDDITLQLEDDAISS